MVEMREVQLEQSISTIVFLFMICEGDVSDVNIKVTLENSDIMLISCLINTHYIQCGGTKLCIRTSLLCEPVSLQVATSCDAVSSRNRQDLIHSLVPPHYVCNKFI